MKIKDIIFSSMKLIFYVGLVVVFWSSLIHGSPFYAIQAYEQHKTIAENNRPLNSHVSYLDINKINTPAFPSERVVILRLDDVQGSLWRDLTINITDTILSKNLSVVLAVIPDRLSVDDSSIMRRYLIEKSKDPRIEIAQHGYKHSVNEFQNLNESETYDAISSGSILLNDTIGITPVTFIPPYNEYNDNTIQILSKLNFRFISSGRSEYEYKDNITYFGFDAETKKSSETELIPILTVLNDCNKALNKKNVCVIMIHPQDYADNGGTMNSTKYSEFVKMLNNLKQLNASSRTFATIND